MRVKSLVSAFFMTFILMVSAASLAFADETTAGTSAADNGAEVQDSLRITTASSGLSVVDFNGYDPRNSAIDFASRMNVRVKGATSGDIRWVSSDPDVVKVLPGTMGGLKDNSECTLIATGIGNATIYVKNGGETTEFRIFVQKLDITSSKYYWTAPANCTYNGRALKPMLAVAGPSYSLEYGDLKQFNGPLKEGVDYTVAYSNNTNVGTASVVVTGTGNFKGSRTFTFKIDPAPANPVTPSNPGNSGGNSSGNTSGSSTPSQAGIAAEAGASVVVNQAPPESVAVSGTWKKSKGKWWFAYDATTTYIQGKKWPVNEWVSIKGKRYHFDSKGYMNSGWFKSGTSWYWLGSDGAMKTGWHKVKGKWYYMASDGVMQTGKKLIDTLIYFLRDSGAMKTGWNKEKLGWFYYTSSGPMKTGWLKTGGKWYYLSPFNGIMQTGWLNVDGKTYYLNGSGAMQKGWKKLTKDGKTSWYYFNKSGEMQKDKWVGNYYVGSDGVMATNTWIGKWHVNASGKWDATK